MIQAFEWTDQGSHHMKQYALTHLFLKNQVQSLHMDKQGQGKLLQWKGSGQFLNYVE